MRGEGRVQSRPGIYDYLVHVHSAEARVYHNALWLLASDCVVGYAQGKEIELWQVQKYPAVQKMSVCE